MNIHAFRLKRGQDIKNEIKKYAEKNQIKAGVVLTCVGCISEAVIRMAGARPGKSNEKKFKGHWEIVSLTGTLSPGDSHLHIAISNEDGKTVGGHMRAGCIVDTTAEVVIGEITNLRFSTELDEATGFSELKVIKKS